MNAFVKKEVRLLLPGFVIFLLMCLSTAFLDDKHLTAQIFLFIALVLCPAMAVYMSLNSFGAEISGGTFSMLLVQPISRREIWRTKTRLLGGALFLGGVLWSELLYVSSRNFADFSHFHDLFVYAWVALFVIYSGSLWTVLLIRQVSAAFWFTILLPPVIMVALLALMPKRPDWFEPVALGTLSIYSVAGYMFARRLFFRAQDVQWTGGTIALPGTHGAFRVLGDRGEKRFYRPKTALFWKELQLHQSQFVVGGVLVLMQIAVVLLRHYGNYSPNSAQTLLLQCFWALWIVMPLLVGVSAVAEERKLGTLSSQLCLPVKRRTQFAIKLWTIILLSIFLGLLMPLLLEPRSHELLRDRANGLLLLGVVVAITVISFYASTLARNTLQALGSGVLGFLLFGTLIANARTPELLFHYPLWRGGLIYFLGVPILFATLLKLSYGNSQRLEVSGKVASRNIFVLTATLAVALAATAAVYHRFWEKLTPFEPAHGPSRLSASDPGILQGHFQTDFVRLPGGRIWAVEYWLNTFSLLDPFRMIPQKGRFINGSNWVNIAQSAFMLERAGIKTDGTLWVSDKVMRRIPFDSLRKVGAPDHLVQLGDEHNWKSVLPNGSLLVVKNDGTLWRWGPWSDGFFFQDWLPTNQALKHLYWPGLESLKPHRIGTESNWAEVFDVNFQTYLRRTDGTLWAWPVPHSDSKRPPNSLPAIQFVKQTIPADSKWDGTTIGTSRGDDRAGITKDGTLRVWGSDSFQLGQDTNWLAVVQPNVEHNKMVALRKDGTLWLWNFPDTPSVAEIADTKPVRLGAYSDWLSISSARGGVSTLAADGSLWYWPLARREDFSGSRNNNDFLPLLDISQKPQRLGNVFH